jgi:hypothetical protein
MSWKDIIKIDLNQAKKLTEEYAPEELKNPAPTETQAKRYLKQFENMLLREDKKGITNKPYLKIVEDLRLLMDDKGPLFDKHNKKRFYFKETKPFGLMIGMKKDEISYESLLSTVAVSTNAFKKNGEKNYGEIIDTINRLWYAFSGLRAGDVA